MLYLSDNYICDMRSQNIVFLKVSITPTSASANVVENDGTQPVLYMCLVGDSYVVNPTSLFLSISGKLYN